MEPELDEMMQQILAMKLAFQKQLSEVRDANQTLRQLIQIYSCETAPIPPMQSHDE